MKKYNVLFCTPYRYHQDLNTQNTPIIPKGTTIKVYDIKHRDLKITFHLARSYKINDIRYIELSYRPTDKQSIKRLCDSLGLFDSIRFNLDIAQALRQRNIRPTLNKYTNLSMFLSHTNNKTL